MESTKPYALVTGASKGLGKAFALELAKRKINLILVSLPGENLQDLTTQICSEGVDAIPYETDLTRKGNIIELTQWLNASYSIKIVINNAGVGGNSHFLDSDIKMLNQMIQLNVRATALITRQLLPNLLQQEGAYVLNVASLAALSPMPFKTVYPATKAFIHSFTRGLQQEYSGSSVSFSVVNPGPMRTNGEVTERMKELSSWTRMLNLTPTQVAAISLEKMFKGEQVIKLDWKHRLSLMLLNLPAGIKMAILCEVFRKELNSARQ